jgi:leucyl-tRNA synthetase
MVTAYKDIAHQIEDKWRQYWARNNIFRTTNPGELGFDRAKPKYVILDFFPYPSGIGLHVGHPLGYIATDVKARFMRMQGYNVLHSMGFDAFGLPAEQFAIQTGQHPRITTEHNISNMLSQLRLLGLGHDPDRGFSTTDPAYYRWTQWIFLQLFNSFYDPTVRWRGPNGHEVQGRARPIGELVGKLRGGEWSIAEDGRAIPTDVNSPARRLNEQEIQVAVERSRLAFLDELPVNWCPALGTVLSNEEVTKDGLSERGDFPVYKRPLRQWVLRITEYAERLLSDLADVDWPAGIKEMQRNWIGRSEGVEIRFAVEGHPLSLNAFSTRPDTIAGTTFMALTPSHPMINIVTPLNHRPMVEQFVAEHQRLLGNPEEPNGAVRGIFTGAYAQHPVTQARIPIFLADYVLAGYGTGVVMGVPAHDERDFAFARVFDIPIKPVVMPPASWLIEHVPAQASDLESLFARAPVEFGEAYTGPGTVFGSDSGDFKIEGLPSSEAFQAVADWLENHGRGVRKIQYKLKDWLFSRQRYWGEPFPIVFDASNGRCYAVTDDSLPVKLPELADFRPIGSDDPNSEPQPPLSRATEWVNVKGIILENDRVRILDRTGDALTGAEGLSGEVREFKRELNTMPNWAGSCWYYLRYFDPKNEQAFVAPEVERYWSLDPTKKNAGSIDLYVGGAEHAVLHLLYARFWHKVLYDLGFVSTHEPFQALFNQGMITADAFRDERGIYQEAKDVEVRRINGVPRAYSSVSGQELEIVPGKMGKRYKNGVPPEEVSAQFSVDTFRLYEMYMGPLEASKPWQTSAVVGMLRFLSAVWRNFERVQLASGQSSIQVTTLLNQTIVKVTNDIENLRMNTALAALIELNHAITREPNPSAADVLTLALMLAPFAPHVSEEIASSLDSARHSKLGSVIYFPWPVADTTKLTTEEIEIVVTINGKKRAGFYASPHLTDDEVRRIALSLDPVIRALKDQVIQRVIVVEKKGNKLINFVSR